MTPIQKGKTAVVILAKEEAQSVADAVRGALSFVDEAIVVCDSREDSTLEVARKAGASTLVNDYGKGKGNAIRFSFDRIDAEVMVLMDADGSHDPGEIPSLLKPIGEGDADMVVGSRIKGGSDELSNNLGERIRFWANLTSTWITNRISGYRLSDVHNGYRAIRTETARKLMLKENRFAIEPEMILRCSELGQRVLEVPTHEFRRKYGNSRLVGWIQVMDCLRCYFRSGFSGPAPRLRGGFK